MAGGPTLTQLRKAGIVRTSDCICNIRKCLYCARRQNEHLGCETCSNPVHDERDCETCLAVACHA